ncbi:retinol dehydrogenase 8-like [Diadema antillarum]|uniref:retinol dehydrogenase 8-like n=1 Tax=Diadema antillarum TaxID=105358 RepID=UPI003A848C23
MAPQIVLITGCSSGIGLSTAVHLAKNPSQYLVYASMRNFAKKGDLEKEAGSLLNKSLFINELDVTKEDQIQRELKAITDKHGRLDILINNAAFTYMGLFEDMSSDLVRNMVDTNVIGTVRLIQEVIPGMKERKSGRIINISSMVSALPFPFCTLYTATKCAMEGLTECLYPELRPFNVWISSVCPGPVHTKLQENAGGIPQTANTDSPSTKLMGKSFDHLLKHLSPFFQTGDDIAKVVSEVLGAPEPKLRYPTSDFVSSFYKDRYVDGIGAKAKLDMYEMIK